MYQFDLASLPLKEPAKLADTCSGQHPDTKVSDLDKLLPWNYLEES